MVRYKKDTIFRVEHVGTHIKAQKGTLLVEWNFAWHVTLKVGHNDIQGDTIRFSSNGAINISIEIACCFKDSILSFASALPNDLIMYLGRQSFKQFSNSASKTYIVSPLPIFTGWFPQPGGWFRFRCRSILNCFDLCVPSENYFFVAPPIIK